MRVWVGSRSEKTLAVTGKLGFWAQPCYNLARMQIVLIFLPVLLWIKGVMNVFSFNIPFFKYQSFYNFMKTRVINLPLITFRIFKWINVFARTNTLFMNDLSTYKIPRDIFAGKIACVYRRVGRRVRV